MDDFANAEAETKLGNDTEIPPMPELSETDLPTIEKFLDYVFNAENLLPIAEIGDLDRWYPLLLRAYELLEKIGRENSVAASARNWAKYLNLRASRLSYLSITRPLLPILAKRAEAAAPLLLGGNENPYRINFPPFVKRGRIKIAVMTRSLHPSSETLAALPFFITLSPKKFAVTVLVEDDPPCPLRNLVVEKFGADAVVALPPSQPVLSLAVARKGNYDLLLLTSNLNAVVNGAFLLAFFRVARKQLVMFCQPHTSGLPNVDGFLVGKELRVDPNDFSEKLYYLDGSGICFYPAPIESPSPQFAVATRETFGLPPLESDVQILASGANYYKIRAELLDFWAKMLSENPRAILVLFPFNPYWSSFYAKENFAVRVAAVCEKYQIARDRFVIIQPLPTRADIRRLLSFVDVYLDSFPYSGAASLLDPLFLGKPVVAMATATVCGGQGAAILRENKLAELVAEDEAAYRQIVKRLLDDQTYRDHCAAKIKAVMNPENGTPPLHDLEKFGAKVERVYKKIYAEIK